MSLLRAHFHGHKPSRQRSCKEKRFYRGMLDALTDATIIYRRWHDSMWPYKCFYCAGYHLGHTPRAVMSLIRNLVGE